MTIQFLHSWSGYEFSQVVTLDSGEETRLISAGLARDWYQGIDGSSSDGDDTEVVSGGLIASPTAEMLSIAKRSVTYIAPDGNRYRSNATSTADGTALVAIGAGGSVAAADITDSGATGREVLQSATQAAARAAIGAITLAEAVAGILLPATTIATSVPLTGTANANRTTYVTANGLTLLVQVDGTGGWVAGDTLIVQGFSGLAATVTADTGVTFLTDNGVTAATDSAVGREVLLQHTQTANQWRVLSPAVVSPANGIVFVPGTGYANAAAGGGTITVGTLVIPAGSVGTRGDVRLKGRCVPSGSTDAVVLTAYGSADTFTAATQLAQVSISAGSTATADFDWGILSGNRSDQTSFYRPTYNAGSVYVLGTGQNPGGIVTATLTHNHGTTPLTITLKAAATANRGLELQQLRAELFLMND
jgi:hypothetical protein